MNWFKKEVSAISQLERLEQIQLSKIQSEREKVWPEIERLVEKRKNTNNEHIHKNIDDSLNWWHTQRVALSEKQNAVRSFTKLIKEHL